MRLDFDNHEDGELNETWSIQTTRIPTQLLIFNSNNSVDDTYILDYYPEEECWYWEREGSYETGELFHEPLSKPINRTQLAEILSLLIEDRCSHLDVEEFQEYLDSFGLGDY